MQIEKEKLYSLPHSNRVNKLRSYMAQNASGGVPKKLRRARVLSRLKAQLDTGVKINKSGETVKLTDGNISRINRELETLKKRV